MAPKLPQQSEKNQTHPLLVKASPVEIKGGGTEMAYIQ